MLICAHTAWKSTSAPLFFCTSGEETAENLKISRGQLAPCQEMRIMRQQTVSSAGCKVPAPNAGFLLASMPSYCRFKSIECSYSYLVSVSVPQDKIRGSAICRNCLFDSRATASFCKEVRVPQDGQEPQNVGHMYLGSQDLNQHANVCISKQLRSSESARCVQHESQAPEGNASGIAFPASLLQYHGEA